MYNNIPNRIDVFSDFIGVGPLELTELSATLNFEKNVFSTRGRDLQYKYFSQEGGGEKWGKRSYSTLILMVWFPPSSGFGSCVSVSAILVYASSGG